jgi:hypothetical protein
MRASCSDQAGLGVPGSPSPITSTAFDRRVVQLQLLSSAIGKRVLDVAQRNSTLGRDPRVLGPTNFTPDLPLPAFASASRRPSASVESYKFLTSTPATRRGGQSRAPRAPARIRDDRGHRNSRRHRDRHRREPLRWFGHRPVQGWREIVRTRQPGPKCPSFPEERIPSLIQRNDPRPTCAHVGTFSHQGSPAMTVQEMPYPVSAAWSTSSATG